MSRPELPRVTVIIPVYDDQAGLDRCLGGLADQTYPLDRVEIICADDGSSPPMQPRGVDAQVLRIERGGSYTARNAASREATGDVLAFTDADTIPRPEWLSRGITRLLEEEPDGFIAGAVRTTTNPRPTGVELWEILHAFPQEHYVESANYGVTANLLVTRRQWELVGPFDGSLASGGDREWGARAGREGLRAVYCPDVVVDHPARRTLRELWRKHRRTRAGVADLRRRGDWVDGDPLIDLLRPRARYHWRLRHDPIFQGNWTWWVRYVGAALSSQAMLVALALRHRQLDFFKGRVRTWRPPA